jgi:hypothetical protein
MKKGGVSCASSGEHFSINLIDSLSRSNMGQNIIGHSQFPNTSSSDGTVSHLFDNTNRETQPGFLDDEKTMDYTVATAPTQFTDIVGALDDCDDDTTTIQSHDSITGAGLLDTSDDCDVPHDFVHPSSDNNPSTIPLINSSGVIEPMSSACSVSTAPSTDEASSIGQDLANYFSDATFRIAQNQSLQQQHHRRVPSWEVSPHNQHQVQSGGRVSPAAFNLPPAFSPATGWSNADLQNQVSNVQGENQQQNYSQGPRLSATANQWNHHQVNASTRHRVGSPEPSSPRGMYYRQQINMNNYPYPLQQLRKPHHQPPLPPSAANTPPRMGTNDRTVRNVSHSNSLLTSHSPHRSLQSQHGGNSGGGVGGASSRSSSEVLKTLLRKKACLYEPDTSRAVALVTWLVGRELALEFGYFSRQQLQAGVHACVSSKIDSGVITRTKVNRCMQIILNSCFHYIIPRSDGSEESGESMRIVFSKVMKNDAFLLSVLPPPWNDITIDKQEILAACEEEMELQKHHRKYETPQSSPRLGSVQAMGSPGGGESVEGDNDAKRAVLLCFNENVRSAEEVFRCHNEFIRDTAHACHLQLSSHEWRLFFGKEASNAQYLWGNVGIPVPHMDGHGPQYTDALGMWTSEEAGVFRTSWCSKRYDHDHELCGFGHVEVNGGWLRRNPILHHYNDELCRFITSASNASDFNYSQSKQVIINECPHGVQCAFAHSQEEIIYHPKRYKQRTCATMGRASGCVLGDVCPGFHPIETYRFPKKSDSRSARYARHGQGHSGTSMDKGSSAVPSSLHGVHSQPDGAPIIYVNPAPISSFEHHLLLPGLQSLYRRQCAFVRFTLLNPRNLASRGETTPTENIYNYNCFDDGYGHTKQLKQSNHVQSTSHHSIIVRPPKPSIPAPAAELRG